METAKTTRGAPKGSQNRIKNRPWTDAINRAILAQDGKALRALADKLVEKALEGDMQAMREIGDRVEGKAAQIIEASGPDGGPIPVQEIRRVIVDSK